jgi:oligogalacturonide lyase
MKKKKILLSFCLAFALPVFIFSKTFAQPVIETGGQKMPAVWIDKDTHHKIVKLSAGLPGNSLSFYFHNNPFIGNEMIFYNNSKQK